MIIKDVEVFHVEESLWGGFWDRERTLPLVNPMSIYSAYKERYDSWYWPGAMVFLRITTDTEHVGIGWAEDGTASAAPIISRHLKRFLLGRDPHDVEVIWDQMFRSAIPYGRRGTAIHAISAIDIALWDLIGKDARQPVYKLLGGKTKEKIPAYASHLHPVGLDKLAIEARGYVEDGFRAMKMRFGYGPADGVEGMEKNVQLIKTLRDAVGYSVELMGDAYMGWNLKYAKEMVKRLERYELSWVEEPLLPDEIWEYAELKKSVSTPISGGEHEFTRYGFRELIDRKAVDILQPDVYRAGGFTELRKICALAAANGLPVIPHTLGVAQIHLGMATQNIPMLECHPMPKWWPDQEEPETAIVGEPKVERGYVVPPEKPGLGVSVKEESFAKMRKFA